MDSVLKWAVKESLPSYVYYVKYLGLDKQTRKTQPC
jgi:hypothetical protein